MIETLNWMYFCNWKKGWRQVFSYRSTTSHTNAKPENEKGNFFKEEKVREKSLLARLGFQRKEREWKVEKDLNILIWDLCDSFLLRLHCLAVLFFRVSRVSWGRHKQRKVLIKSDGAIGKCILGSIFSMASRPFLILLFCIRMDCWHVREFE